MQRKPADATTTPSDQDTAQSTEAGKTKSNEVSEPTSKSETSGEADKKNATAKTKNVDEKEVASSTIDAQNTPSEIEAAANAANSSTKQTSEAEAPASDAATIGESEAQTNATDASKTSTDTTAAVPSETAETEQGLLDGLIDQASKMAEAATEKFSDVLGTGVASTPDADASADNSKVTPSDKAKDSTPLGIANTKVTTSAAGDTILELAGTGKPGSELGIFVDGKRVTATTIHDDGAWSLKQAVEFKGKPVELKVAEYDSTGAIANSQTRSIRPNASANSTNKVASIEKTKSNETPSAGDTDTQSSQDATASANAGGDPADTATKLGKRPKVKKRQTKRRRTASTKRQIRKAKRLKQRQRARSRKRVARSRTATSSAQSSSPYIRTRRNGPWSGVRVTRLNRSVTRRHRGLRPAQRKISKRRRHIRRLRN